MLDLVMSSFSEPTANRRRSDSTSADSNRDFATETCHQCISADPAGAIDILQIGLNREPVANARLVEKFCGVFVRLPGQFTQHGAESDLAASRTFDLVQSWIARCRSLMALSPRRPFVAAR